MGRWFDKDLEKVKMNLRSAMDLIEDARYMLEGIKIGQEERNDNMPENLQNSQRFEVMSERLDIFDQQLSELEEIDLFNIVEELENIL